MPVSPILFLLFILSFGSLFISFDLFLIARFLSNFGQNKLNIDNTGCLAHAQLDCRDDLVLIQELVLVIFSNKFVIEFDDSLLEFVVAQILTATDDLVILVVEFETEEKECRLLVFVRFPVVFDLGDSLIVAQLVQLTLRLIVFSLVLQADSHLLHLAELGKNRKLVETEFQGLQVLDGELTQGEHVGVLELVLHFVTGQHLELLCHSVFV